MLLITNFLELGMEAARAISWQVANMPSTCHLTLPPPPCHEPAMALRGRFQKGIFVAWQGNGMVCVNQTRPHYVNQMGKTQSKALAERHGNGMVCVNPPILSPPARQQYCHHLPTQRDAAVNILNTVGFYQMHSRNRCPLQNSPFKPHTLSAWKTPPQLRRVPCLFTARSQGREKRLFAISVLRQTTRLPLDGIL
jgi:hypothetical protein